MSNLSLKNIIELLNHEVKGWQVDDCVHLPTKTDGIARPLKNTVVVHEAKDGKCYISRISTNAEGKTVITLGPTPRRYTTGFLLDKLIENNDLKLFINEEEN